MAPRGIFLRTLRMSLIPLPPPLQPTRSDKETLRPLYELYRSLKREMARRGLSAGVEEDEEGDGAAASRAAPAPRRSDPPVAVPAHGQGLVGSRERSHRSTDAAAAAPKPTDSHRDRPPAELRDVESILRSNDLAALQREKRRLQVRLRAYEARFRSEKGRSVRYRRDITPVQGEYERYKALKKQIQQLER